VCLKAKYENYGCKFQAESISAVCLLPFAVCRLPSLQNKERFIPLMEGVKKMYGILNDMHLSNKKNAFSHSETRP
jgi:hypothetical protein